MKLKWMGLLGVLCASFLCMQSVVAKEDDEIITKRLQATEALSLIPEGYEYIDWQQRAKAFNDHLFDTTHNDWMFYEPGLYWTDKELLGMVTYVDDERVLDTSQAITILTALLSAQKLDGESFDELVEKVEAYYNFNIGEGAFLNYRAMPSREVTFWEQVYPGLLYFMLMDHAEPTTNSDALLLQIADSWYDVVMDLGGKSGAVDFAYTGYDFKEGAPYDNGEWIEKDAAAGVALMQYYAFMKFGDKKYMRAATLCMDYLDDSEQNPGHRILYYYLPYLAARLNATEHKSYNTSKFMEFFFTRTHYENEWGWIPGSGLMGERTNYGGTPHAYESLMAASALVPMLKYDQRYAVEVGRYLLHLTQDLEIFFEDGALAPFETVSRQGSIGSQSVQAGTALGLFAAMIEPTDVDGILRVNLNLNEYYDNRQSDNQSFLLFNPGAQEEVVTYDIQSKKTVSLYDLVARDFIVENVTDVVGVTVPAEGAVIVLEIELDEGDNRYDINRKVEQNVTANNNVGVNIVNLQEELEEDTPLHLELLVQDTGIETVTISVDGEDVFIQPTYNEPYLLKLDDFEYGYHSLQVELESSGGIKDYAYAQIFINNHTMKSEIPALSEWSHYGGSITNKQPNRGIEISGLQGQGIISPAFEIDFSQEPILVLDIAEFSAPWTLVLIDQQRGEQLIVIEDCVESGVVKLNLNYHIPMSNKSRFNLYGPHEVRLALLLTEDDASLSLQKMRMYNEGVHVLEEKLWAQPFTPKKMTQWQSRLSGVGKINYYDGDAYVKNLNETFKGSGGVKTEYFAVDLKRNPMFKISVKEVDELWSLLVYAEGKSDAQYLQYPTDKTGVFSYDISEVLSQVYAEDELAEIENLQFWIISNGEYEAITKIGYLRLDYEKGWVQLASVGVMGLLGLGAIFVNINKDE